MDIVRYLSNNSYPGRGIIVGTSADGSAMLSMYFIMGRSENSRNRVFVPCEDGIRTEAYDPAKCSDPSLIIYHPVREFQNRLIITNGDQTDTIRDTLRLGGSFTEALATRTYEPDAPHFTSRVSAMCTLPKDGAYAFEMEILKKEADSSACQRLHYTYGTLPVGTCRILHTYAGNSEPLPPFSGEPACVTVSGDFIALTAAVWDALDHNNRISLFSRFTPLDGGASQTKIINRLED
ncbi:MAG: IMP cyclohydrolase [Eubacteriales bacterium]|nr:IMP cyclohydrolase [Eubacteriales bacterium]